MATALVLTAPTCTSSQTRAQGKEKEKAKAKRGRREKVKAKTKKKVKERAKGKGARERGETAKARGKGKKSRHRTFSKTSRTWPRGNPWSSATPRLVMFVARLAITLRVSARNTNNHSTIADSTRRKDKPDLQINKSRPLRGTAQLAPHAATIKTITKLKVTNWSPRWWSIQK